MRARDLAIVALAACAANPDPRSPSPEQMASQAYGGWIVIHTADRQEVSGELIALDAERVYLLPAAGGHLHWVKRAAVTDAALYEYEAGGFGAWGLLGSLSTASHGYFLVFSLPIWVLSSTITNAAESHHVILHYPATGWDEIARWARFPQGLPPKLQLPEGPPGVTPPSAE
ncbi:MAG: hypothetical protein ACM31C_10850 [Acidobacteriota bacterium]